MRLPDDLLIHLMLVSAHERVEIQREEEIREREGNDKELTVVIYCYWKNPL